MMPSLPRLHPNLADSAFDNSAGVDWPAPSLLNLPEKVIQFGTGTFLRAFADFFIDQANRQGIFNGRIVMVGSTGSGRSNLINEQGGLYTLRIQGLEEGKAVERFIVVSSVSRALSAADQWEEVLAVAHNPELELAFSNTTEIGIRYDPDDAPGPHAPRSFPGKLTAFLNERATHFDFDPSKGIVVLPCELTERNGATLKEIVLRLASDWDLGDRFQQWTEVNVLFCDTLVDRISPGIPDGSVRAEIEAKLGYEDALLTSAEVYRLWPIQGSEAALSKLSFAEADDGVILTEDITPYRDRKVRLLNGAHTISVPLAFLAGEETVLDMMGNAKTSTFVSSVMLEEIVPSLDVDGGEAFANEVIDRFSNPYLRHKLIDITLQMTSKMRMRILPSLKRFYEKQGRLPNRILRGFATYLWFMRSERQGDRFVGYRGEELYPVRDDQAGYFADLWAGVEPQNSQQLDALVQTVLANEAFWGEDLNRYPSLANTIGQHLHRIATEGVASML